MPGWEDPGHLLVLRTGHSGPRMQSWLPFPTDPAQFLAFTFPAASMQR